MRTRRLPMTPAENLWQLRQLLGRILTVSLIAFALSTYGNKAGAQNVSDRQTCNAAICEDEAMVIAAVDAALERSDLCGAYPVRLLSTLHPAPYTAFADGVRGRGPRRGLPSSPATLRLEDIGILSARRFRHSVTIVDSVEVQREGRTEPVCLVVASPPTLRDHGEMRVIVAVSESKSGQSIQYFLFLRREGARWVVSRKEIGYRT